jgi:hypothetical protein
LDEEARNPLFAIAAKLLRTLGKAAVPRILKMFADRGIKIPDSLLKIIKGITVSILNIMQ